MSVQVFQILHSISLKYFCTEIIIFFFYLIALLIFKKNTFVTQIVYILWIFLKQSKAKQQLFFTISIFHEPLPPEVINELIKMLI